MYTFFQPRMSVEQEEADIQEIIDKEYEFKEQECNDYYKQIEEDYYKNNKINNYEIFDKRQRKQQDNKFCKNY